jgi:hypothetical protein
MKYLLIICATLLSLAAYTQDETVKKLQADADKKIKKEEDTTSTWRKGGIYNLNLSQGSLSNWASGGDDFSLSLNSILSLFAFYKKDRHSWDNTLVIYDQPVWAAGKTMTGLTC